MLSKIPRLNITLTYTHRHSMLLVVGPRRIGRQSWLGPLPRVLTEGRTLGSGRWWEKSGEFTRNSRFTSTAFTTVHKGIRCDSSELGRERMRESSVVATSNSTACRVRWLTLGWRTLHAWC